MRSAIKAIIGHMKCEYTSERDALKGEICDLMNVLIIALGNNFKKLLKLLKVQMSLFAKNLLPLKR